MLGLLEIKDEIINTWKSAKTESAFEFKRFCDQYSSDPDHCEDHLNKNIYELSDNKDSAIGNAYINTTPKINLLDGSNIPLHIGELSMQNLDILSKAVKQNVLDRYYDECIKINGIDKADSFFKESIKGYCYTFFVKIQTKKRFLDLLEQIKAKRESLKSKDNTPKVRNTITNINPKPIIPNFKDISDIYDIKILFQNLKNKGMIDTDLNTWTYVCGVVDKAPDNFKPIIWKKKQKHLVYLIDKVFADRTNRGHWQITVKVFILDNGNTMSANYLKTAHSKCKKQDDTILEIETQLKSSKKQ